jgi:ADP-ribose pyrophosphatase YjhB (NUDIX family)
LTQPRARRYAAGIRQSIEILVRAACVREGKVLLCRRVGTRLTFLPGGHVEFREPARAALARELREELGCPARVGRLLGVAEHAFRQKGRWHAEINLVFAADLVGADARRPLPSRESWLVFEWHRLDRLGRARLEPAVLRRALPRWLAGAVFPPFAGTAGVWRLG